MRFEKLAYTPRSPFFITPALKALIASISFFWSKFIVFWLGGAQPSSNFSIIAGLKARSFRYESAAAFAGLKSSVL